MPLDYFPFHRKPGVRALPVKTLSIVIYFTGNSVCGCTSFRTDALGTPTRSSAAVQFIGNPVCPFTVHG